MMCKNATRLLTVKEKQELASLIRYGCHSPEHAVFLVCQEIFLPLQNTNVHYVRHMSRSLVSILHQIYRIRMLV